MECITSDPSQKTTLKEVQWNSLLQSSGFETLVHMWKTLKQGSTGCNGLSNELT